MTSMVAAYPIGIEQHLMLILRYLIAPLLNIFSMRK